MKIPFYIKSILLTLLVSSTTYAAPTVLSGYNALLSTLQQGSEVRAIINFDGCFAKDGTRAQLPPNMVGGMNFSTFNHYPVQIDPEHKKYAVAASITQMIEHPSFGFVANYVRLRVFADNTVELHSAYYDPTNYQQKRAANYTCKIGEKMEDSGVVLIAP